MVYLHHSLFSPKLLCSNMLGVRFYQYEMNDKNSISFYQFNVDALQFSSI